MLWEIIINGTVAVFSEGNTATKQIDNSKET